MGDVPLTVRLVGIETLVPQVIAQYLIEREGNITQIRFIVESATAADEAGNPVEVELPSQDETGLKAVKGGLSLPLRMGEILTVVLKLDPDRSIVQNRGRGRDAILRPTIRIYDAFSEAEQQPQFVPHELLVFLDPAADPLAFAAFNASIGASVLFTPPRSHLYLLRLPVGIDERATLALYRAQGFVRAGTLNWLGVLTGHLIPTDPNFQNQWGLSNEGTAETENPDHLSPQTFPADIDAPQAWRFTRGSRGVRVAILDTGVDLTHPDLAGNLFTNEDEIPGNGVDDDCNGYADDARGVSFVPFGLDPESGLPIPLGDVNDTDGHGTFAAGIVGALHNGPIGVYGVAGEVTIIPVVIAGRWPPGAGYVFPSFMAWLGGLYYARDVAADVVLANASWRFDEPLDAQSQIGVALQAAQVDGVLAGQLLVAGAGNEGMDVDREDAFWFPAEWTREPALICKSFSRANELGTTNYGQTSVDIAGPGDAIFSLWRGGLQTYQAFGSSFAAAHVAGVAALVLSVYPEMRGDPQALREQVRLSSVNVIVGEQDDTRYGFRRVNAFNALNRGPDRDGDDLADRLEVILGSDPAVRDTDADGLSDLDEAIVYGTDPARKDTDGDAWGDRIEVAWDPAGEMAVDPSQSPPGTPPDSTPPVVLWASPAAGAEGVATGRSVVVRFSEPLLGTTVGADTLYLLDVVRGTRISAGIRLSAVGDAATLTPGAPLPAAALIALVVTTGIQDRALISLPREVRSTFFTAGYGAPPRNECLRHPSYGESTLAGGIRDAHGMGGLFSVTAPFPRALDEEPDACCSCLPDYAMHMPDEGLERSRVILSNGAYVLSLWDLEVPDLWGICFHIQRTYRSNNQDEGAFGPKWALNLDQRIAGFVDGSPGPVELITGDGRVYTYGYSVELNSYIAPAGFHDVLTHDTARDLLLRRNRNGYVHAYDPISGRLIWREDRNGNRLTIDRDPLARIRAVTDAIGRRTTFAYHETGAEAGLVSQITDFAGRAWRYEYDSARNLISVTHPGTEEFPDGRTVRYGYGGNHLLVACDNARGQRILTTDYDAAGLEYRVRAQAHGEGTLYYAYLGTDRLETTETDRNRNVERVEHGPLGEPTERHVETQDPPLQPGAPDDYETKFGHNGAGEIVSVTEPRGNQHQYQRNPLGLITHHAHLSALNASDQITGDWVWDSDLPYDAPLGQQLALPMRYTDPRGFTAYFIYDHEILGDRATQEGGALPALSPPATYPGLAGNLRATVRPRPSVIDYTDPLNPLSDPTLRQDIVDYWSYAARGLAVFHVDPMGHAERYEWSFAGIPYQRGNGASNPNYGYLVVREQATSYAITELDLANGGAPSGPPSAPGLNLREEMSYDPAGHLLAMTDPRGFTRRMAADALGYIQEETVPAPFAYRTFHDYDANGCVTETRVENTASADLARPCDTETPAGEPPVYVIRTFYDALNQVTRTDAQITASHFAVTRYDYDPNQNLRFVTDPEGRRTRTDYDERDLPIRVYEGYGSGAQGVTETRYDANGNPIRRIDDDGNTAFESMLYDGFDRLVRHIDELANYSVLTYDAGGLITQTRSYDAANTLLSQTFHHYDELGREVQTDRDWFDAATGNGVSDPFGEARMGETLFARPSDATGNLVHSVTIYDEGSHPIATIDDAGRISETFYDDADRIIATADPRGNTADIDYDAASNPIRVVQTERADTGPDPAPFISHTFYDGLGRVTATVSSTGATTRLLYDSRSNLVRRYDAQALRGAATASDLDRYGEHGFALGNPAITGPGNVTEYAYDGLSRRIRTSYVLTADGTGDTDEVDRIEVTEEWDDSGLRIAMTDDNGHRTRYDHDQQGRLYQTIYADGTSITLTFDGADRVTRTVDANGTVVVPHYDAADRLISRAITPAPAIVGSPVVQTVSELFEYDGLSRLLTARDDDSTVTLTYDSLSNPVSETLGGSAISTALPYAVTRTLDSLGNRRTLTYPGGTLTLDYAVDSLDRVTAITDRAAGNVASYAYVGPNLRMLSRQHGNGTHTDVAYDNARRPLGWGSFAATGQMLSAFATRWDPMSNRRLERDVLAGLTGMTDVYGYDSIYRLTTERSHAALTQQFWPANDTVDPFPTWYPTTERTYGMDGVGNRTAVTSTSGSTVSAETYTLSGGPALVNGYTEVRPSGLIEQPTWDRNGNLSRIYSLTSSGSSTAFASDVRYYHDYRNRLVNIRRFAADGTTILSDILYFYDALGRRIAKEGGGTVGPFSRIVYVSDGNQEIQERSYPSGTLLREYVYGNGIDELIRMLNAQTGQSFYYHTNSLGTVTALSNSAGLLAERYRYDVYGAIEESRDGLGNVLPLSNPSPAGNPYFFTARRLDVEETSALPSLRHRLYHYRARSYMPAWGRFVQRDPAGSRYDLTPTDYSYVASRPPNRIDPTGLVHESVFTPIPPRDVDILVLNGWAPYIAVDENGAPLSDPSTHAPLLLVFPPLPGGFTWGATRGLTARPVVTFDCECNPATGRYTPHFRVAWTVLTIVLSEGFLERKDVWTALGARALPSHEQILAHEELHRVVYRDQFDNTVRALSQLQQDPDYPTHGECMERTPGEMSPILEIIDIEADIRHERIELGRK